MAGAYTNEMAQDAVGGMLTDTASIDFTYDDVNNQILAAVIPGGVNHDNLLNMSVNKHIDHTLVSITGSDGLSGGGDISASRTITLPAVGTAGTYGNSSSVPVITTDTKGRVTGVTMTNIAITSAAVSDFDESVQDVLGSLLMDTHTINFTYNDVANTLAVDVKTQMSITSDASGLKLSGDVASPGNFMLYGTDASGVKGWYVQSGSGTFYRKDEDIDIASPYIIDFGTTQRESIVFNTTTGGDANWNYVVLLLHLNGTNGSIIFPDSSNYQHTITRYGTPTISTTQSKFGGTSLALNGTTDYLRTLSSPELAMSGDYTVEAWIYSTASGVRDIFTWGPSPYWNIWKNGTNQLIFFINGTDRITGGTITDNTWHHIAATRTSGTNRLFLNGALLGTYVEATAIPADTIWIGGWPTGTNNFQGYIDEVRITIGVSRYTEAFTPSTSEFLGSNQYYAQGSQLNTLYQRSSGGFAWYKGGTYSSNQIDPGIGGSLQMVLATSGKLFVPMGIRVGEDQGIDTDSTLIEATDNHFNSWMQINVQNFNGGNAASSDVVVTMDTGNDTSGYLDLGINCSGYNQAEFNSGGPGDGYLLMNGGNLAIITTGNFAIGFFTNGGTLSQERMMIHPNGDVTVGGTTALATSATAGFLWIPEMTGMPTGTVTARTGKKPIVMNTTNNEIWYQSNSIWRSLDNQFVASNSGGYVSGNFYDQSTGSVGSSTLASATNRLTVMPFAVWKDLTIDQIGIAISSGASGNANIVIYASDPTTGWPTSRIYVSGNISTAAIGYASVNYDYTFRKGMRYWIGVHTSAAPTLRSIPLSNLQNLGLSGSTGTTYFSVLRQTVTFGSSPATWTFASTQLTSADGYSIRMRAV
jgi:hypothetical protein